MKFKNDNKEIPRLNLNLKGNNSKILFHIPFWQLKTSNFKEKKNKIIDLFKDYPEEKTGTKDFFTNRHNINKENVIPKFVNILSNEIEQICKEFQNDFVFNLLMNFLILIFDMCTSYYKLARFETDNYLEFIAKMNFSRFDQNYSSRPILFG